MSAGLWVLTILMGASAVLNWIAAAADLRKVFAFTKIAVIALLIILFVLLGGIEKRTIWFMLALLFSLAGDVLLLLSSRWFLYGLAAFWLALMAYIIGYNQTIPPLLPSVFGILLIAIPVFIIYRILRWEVQSKPHLRKMAIPIIGYTIILWLMVLSTSMSLFKSEWQLQAALPAALGGVLFFCSDAMLAYDRFVKPFKQAHMLVMMTYHLAHFGLILGVVQRFELIS